MWLLWRLGHAAKLRDTPRIAKYATGAWRRLCTLLDSWAVLSTCPKVDQLSLIDNPSFIRLV